MRHLGALCLAFHRNGDLQLHRQELHNNQDELAFIYDTVVLQTLREDVRSILRELSDDATVFIISDHGFTPVPAPTFTVPDQVLTDSGDVKYGVGRLKRPLEGNDARNGVVFQVGDLGIPDKTGKVVKQVTAIASYHWKNRRVRTTIHGTVEIQLDTTRIRSRLDSKLDSIMGMVPAGLR